MPFRVLAGLPSFNEADTIAQVTTDLDRALATLPFPAEAVLVNADSSSTDGTQQAFLEAPTIAAKQVIATARAGGKGTNTLALLRLACEGRFDAVISIDADLADVPAAWVHALIGHIHAGIDFCYPLRPPTWNGGDLTYQLAYPVLAAAFGADLREPLCGDIAVSRRGAEHITAETWTTGDRHYGGDFLIASLAVTHAWTAVALTAKRRNKLRSFTTAPSGDYRMGGKFAENALALQRRTALRLRKPPPERLVTCPAQTPGDPHFTVPGRDPDIARLAASSASRLRRAAREDAFAVFPRALVERLDRHATSDEAVHGLGWPEWRDCLIAWIRDHDAPAEQAIPVDLLETLFLNRVVGHHTEIAGTGNWYDTVVHQARDMFAHRHALWADR